jgi:hypothetical protein
MLCAGPIDQIAAHACVASTGDVDWFVIEKETLLRKPSAKGV